MPSTSAYIAIALATAVHGLERADILGLADLKPTVPLIRRANLQSPYEGYQYVGCWSDSPNPRTLSYTAPSLSPATIENCLNICASGGYSYAGLEYYHECYCGNSLARGSYQVDESLCSDPCDDDQSETCGGNNYHLSLYALAAAVPSSTATALPTGAYSPPTGEKDGVQPGPYDYVGCYTDQVDGSTRTLQNSWGASSMSLETCANLCLNYAQQIYFGVEDGGQCFCDNQINAPNYQVAEDNCNIACTGDSTEICGGLNYINVYSDDASAHFYDVYGPVGGGSSPSQASASASRASASSVASQSRYSASLSRQSASSVASVSQASVSSARSVSSVSEQSVRSQATASQASVRSQNSASSVSAASSRASVSSALSVSSVSAQSSRSVASVQAQSSRSAAQSSLSSAESSRASVDSSIASQKSSESAFHTSLSSVRSLSSASNQNAASSRTSVYSASVASVLSSKSSVAASRSSASSVASVSRASVDSVASSRSSVYSVSQASVASYHSSLSSVASVSRASVSSSKASVSSSLSAALSATTEIYRYINCYPYDGSDPPLPLHPTVPGLTLQGCANKCYNHTYWGVAAGTQCYCGGDLSNAGSPVPISNCYDNSNAMFCAGNPSEKCGSNSAMPIFGNERFVGDCSQANYYNPSDPCRTVIGSKFGTTVQNRVPGSFTGTGISHRMSISRLSNLTSTSTNRNARSTGTGPGPNSRVCVIRTAIVNVQLNSTVSVFPKGWHDAYTTFGMMPA